MMMTSHYKDPYKQTRILMLHVPSNVGEKTLNVAQMPWLEDKTILSYWGPFVTFSGVNELLNFGRGFSCLESDFSLG